MAQEEKIFGTFKGVYLPSVLTIFGVVMYLRLGWVVGEVGLTSTLTIVTLSSAITFLTGLSIASIATNMKIGAGGAYFMISRSLGLEIGAAIGLPLFMAQALGVSFYVAGFAESVAPYFPGVSPQLIGAATLGILMILALFSAQWAMKVQLVIFLLIFASLTSFALGHPYPAEVAIATPPETRLGFWVVFAIFFPAVTGIEAGIALSGNLKDPAKSLPLGTIAAVLTGWVAYMALPILLDHWVPEAALRTDMEAFQKVSRWAEAILLGIWGATLSSALGALMGGPRTLQALARDKVILSFLARGSKKEDNPRPAILVTSAIAMAGIFLGDLNAIASLLTMFFLTSYGFLNFATGMETLMDNPSWRPRFKVPAALSLLGALGAMGTMLMIDPGATMLATLIGLGIFLWMAKRDVNASFSDIRIGILLYFIRKMLITLENLKQDPRTWRPNILALIGSPTKRWYLVETARALSQKKGVLILTSFFSEKIKRERMEAMREAVRASLEKKKVEAFLEFKRSEDPLTGAKEMLRYHGIGTVKPNTLLVGVSEQTANHIKLAELILESYQSKRNLILVKEEESAAETSLTAPGEMEKAAEGEKDSKKDSKKDGKTKSENQNEQEPPKEILIWWSGHKKNGGFMLALAHLLTKEGELKGARIRLKTLVKEEAQILGVRSFLKEFLDQGRLELDWEVLKMGEKPPFAVIEEHSHEADLVLLGIRPPAEEESSADYALYYRQLLGKIENLPDVFLILVGEEIDFLSIFT